MNEQQKFYSFFGDPKIRAIWDEQNAKWKFSIANVIGILKQDVHYNNAPNL